MFHPVQMQLGFFGSAEIGRWRDKLSPLLTTIEPLPRRSPIGQLIKSMIGGRTKDAVSRAAYDRLVATFGGPRRVMLAKPEAVLECIAEVTFAEDKVRYVQSALRMIHAERGSFDLSFLGELPLDAALAWLERLPGVGRKVAASTLNASTLDRPVFIVDGHVQRVLQRLGLVPPHADIRAASEAVTAAMPHWSGADFLAFHMQTKCVGQLWCRPEAPMCRGCPLAGECRVH